LPTMTFGLCSNYDVRPALMCAEHQILDSEHANPTFDGNAAPTEPRVRRGAASLARRRTPIRIDSATE